MGVRWPRRRDDIIGDLCASQFVRTPGRLQAQKSPVNCNDSFRRYDPKGGSTRVSPARSDPASDQGNRLGNARLAGRVCAPARRSPAPVREHADRPRHELLVRGCIVRWIELQKLGRDPDSIFIRRTSDAFNVKGHIHNKAGVGPATGTRVTDGTDFQRISPARPARPSARSSATSRIRTTSPNCDPPHGCHLDACCRV
jgi:hypothetical protein